jgi:hypothetical protein
LLNLNIRVKPLAKRRIFNSQNNIHDVKSSKKYGLCSLYGLHQCNFSAQYQASI